MEVANKPRSLRGERLYHGNTHPPRCSGMSQRKQSVSWSRPYRPVPFVPVPGGPVVMERKGGTERPTIGPPSLLGDILMEKETGPTINSPFSSRSSLFFACRERGKPPVSDSLYSLAEQGRDVARECGTRCVSRSRSFNAVCWVFHSLYLAVTIVTQQINS